MKDQNVIRAISDSAWAILPEKLAAICDVVAMHASGARLSDDEIDARVGAADRGRRVRNAGAIAVLSLHGVIAQRMDFFMRISGGTSTERFTREFREVMADSEIDAVVIDVDSPGGTTAGVMELSNEIFRARGKKPIVAVANTLAASAAYWIASAADELVVTPSGDVGSIGVFAVHTEFSKKLEMDGIKATMVRAGKFKAELNEFEPLSSDAEGHLQERVDEVFGDFQAAVARNRGVPIARVRDGFGQGRTVSAKKAVAVGMADRVATLDETVIRLGTPQGRSRVGSRRTDEASVPGPAPEAQHPSKEQLRRMRRRLAL